MVFGNPEEKYNKTRHNMGFDVVNKLAEKWGIKLNKSGFKSIYGSGIVENEKAILCKPQTYMNLSGKAVIECLNFFKLTNKDILVIYDDATLEFGTFRFRKEGSFGGHNGIKSIIQVLNTQTFDRLKVGVGPVPERMDINNFVLGNFTSEELTKVSKMGEIAISAVDLWLKEGILAAQTKYNGKVI